MPAMDKQINDIDLQYAETALKRKAIKALELGQKPIPLPCMGKW